MLASYQEVASCGFHGVFLFGTGSFTLPRSLLEILVRSTALW